MLIEKVKSEIREFVREVVTENGPRYKDPREWAHLWADLFVSLFSMSYTLGHIAALAVPAWIVYELFV